MSWVTLGTALESALSDMLEKVAEPESPAKFQGRNSANGGGETVGTHANPDRMSRTPLRLVVNNRSIAVALPTERPTPAAAIDLVLVAGAEKGGDPAPAFRSGPEGEARETGIVRIVRIVRG